MSCSSKKLIISEQERKHILNLYDLLNEQNVQPILALNKTIKVNLDAGYHSERYILKSSEFLKVLEEIKTFLNNNRDDIFSLNIFMMASESNIPNTDAENNNEELNSGELSKLRLTSIKNIINNQLQNLIGSSLITTPIITEQFINGTTPWVGQTFGNYKCEVGQERLKCLTAFRNCKEKDENCKKLAQAYKNEQFIQIKIQATKIPKSTLECITGAKITIWTDSHHCNEAKYAVRINGKLISNDNQNIPDLIIKDGSSNYLKRYATMDNKNGPYDMMRFNKDLVEKGPRYNYFTISDELAKSILLNSMNNRGYSPQGSLHIELQCLSDTGNNCHGDVINWEYTDSKGNKKNGTGKGIVKPLATKKVGVINGCSSNV